MDPTACQVLEDSLVFFFCLISGTSGWRVDEGKWRQEPCKGDPQSQHIATETSRAFCLFNNIKTWWAVLEQKGSAQAWVPAEAKLLSKKVMLLESPGCHTWRYQTFMASDTLGDLEEHHKLSENEGSQYPWLMCEYSFQFKQKQKLRPTCTCHHATDPGTETKIISLP